MGTKTISISDEAYGRLKFRKRKNESFSDVVTRITNKTTLLDFAGILKEKEARSIEEKIKKSRSLSRERSRKLEL